MLMEHRRYRKGDQRGDRAVRVRMTEHEHERLKARAAQSGQTLADYVRNTPSVVVLPSLFDYLAPLEATRTLVAAATEPHDPDRAARYGAASLDWWDANWRTVLAGLGWRADQMAVVESLMQESSDSA